MKSIKFTQLPAALALAFSAAAGAQTSAADHAAHHPTAAASTTAAMTEGEVRKIDKAQGKVTLRHGPIVNLGMPGMTMVFKAADTRMLDALNEGDKVRFSADKVDGVYTVTSIEAAK